MEAEADEQQWKIQHPKSLRLTMVKEKTVKTPVGKLKQAKEMLDKLKEAKDAVDKARKGPEERKPGDTLKEYRDRLKDTFTIAMNAKKNLTSMTGNIARKQFQEVNDTIDRFNQSRADFIRRVQSATGSPVFARYTSVLSQYPAIPRLTPQDLKGKLEPDTPESKFTVWVFKQQGGRWVKQEDRTLSTDDEAQARKYVADVKAVQGWTATSNLPEPQQAKAAGSLSLQGTRWRRHVADTYDDYEFLTNQLGNVVSIAVESGRSTGAGGRLLGAWKQSGDRVEIKWGHSDDSDVFVGIISGDTISGKLSEAGYEYTLSRIK